MTAALISGSIKAEFTAQIANILTDASQSTANIGESQTVRLENGTSGANKADGGLTSKNRELSSGSDETIDLYDLGNLDIGFGAGRDSVGLQQQNAEIIGLMIVNVGGTGFEGDLIVGGEGTGAAWADFLQSDSTTLRLPPKSWMAIGCDGSDPWTVTDVTSHLLKFAASGANVKYSFHWISR